MMSLEILPNLKKEETKFSKEGWGHGFELITKEELEEVMTGEKAIALFDGEYTHWIAIKKPAYEKRVKDETEETN